MSRILVLLVSLLAAIAILVIGGLMLAANLPDFLLILQGGGPSQQMAVAPRNIDVWLVYPDSQMRFMTLFYPGATLSEDATQVAGPLANKQDDLLNEEAIGATSFTRSIAPGPGNDASRIYGLYTLTRDPAIDFYGINVLEAAAPYISTDLADPTLKVVGLGAEPQTFYLQKIVAVGFAPGTQIKDLFYTLSTPATAAKPVVLKPYRRASINGWLLYYFDTTALPVHSVIQIRYLPSSQPLESYQGISPLEVDKAR
jgi:hypothetical protein